MPNNDLIIRPKVDKSALRKSAKQMEREYANSGIRAARQTAQFTQQALTRAYQLAAKAGGSALHSAFQVGLGGVMQAMRSMLQDIDATVDRVEGRTAQIGGDLVNRANALGVDSANLLALEITAAQKGVDSEKVDMFIQRFGQALETRPELGNFRNTANESGIETALVQYLQSHPHVKGMQGIGLEVEDQKYAIMLAQQLQGATSFDQLMRTYSKGEADINTLRAAIENAEANNAAQDANAAIMQIREVLQAGRISSGQTGQINQTRLNDQQMQFQQENNLDEALQIRQQMQKMQIELNKMMTEVIKYVGKIIDAYQKDGIGAAFSTALEPVTGAITSLTDNLAAKVQQGVSDALPEWLQSGKPVPPIKVTPEMRSQWHADPKNQNLPAAVREIPL